MKMQLLQPEGVFSGHDQQTSQDQKQYLYFYVSNILNN